MDRYGSRIFNWCIASGVQPQDAADVTQEVLMKLAKSRLSLVISTVTDAGLANLTALTKPVAKPFNWLIGRIKPEMLVVNFHLSQGGIDPDFNTERSSWTIQVAVQSCLRRHKVDGERYGEALLTALLGLRGLSHQAPGFADSAPATRNAADHGCPAAATSS